VHIYESLTCNSIKAYQSEHMSECKERWFHPLCGDLSWKTCTV